jgi:hypothetical protein
LRLEENWKVRTSNPINKIELKEEDYVTARQMLVLENFNVTSEV